MASHSTFHSQIDRNSAQGQEVTSVNPLISGGGNCGVKKNLEVKANLKKERKKKNKKQQQGSLTA